MRSLSKQESTSIFSTLKAKKVAKKQFKKSGETREIGRVGNPAVIMCKGLQDDELCIVGAIEAVLKQQGKL